MNAKIAGLAVYLVSTLNGGMTYANHTGMEVINAVDSIFGLPATPPDNVVERFFPTEVLPNHRKSLRFGALFQTTRFTSTSSTSVTVWLAWTDPRFPDQPQMSAPTTFEMFANSQRQFSLQLVLPFCPPEVGVHVQNNGPGEPLQFTGGLGHQTIPIPEPRTVALGILGAAFLVAAASRYRRRCELRLS